MSGGAYVLVTGSRDFRSVHVVERALLEAWHDAAQLGHQELTVVHGGAPGADSIAARWAKRHAGDGVEVLAVPADWDGPCRKGCKPGHRRQRRGGGDYCPAQGGWRNQRMVDEVAPLVGEGRVVCLAFFARPGSSGTADCCRRAEAAGVPVRRFGAVR